MSCRIFWNEARLELIEKAVLLFNKSFQRKIFPNWKIAFTIPLFKRGDESLPSN
jgi:hypothetical protein